MEVLGGQGAHASECPSLQSGAVLNYILLNSIFITRGGGSARILDALRARRVPPPRQTYFLTIDYNV